MSALVVDTGPLYAYVDADDAAHEACLELLRDWPGPLVVPVLAVTEAAYLVGTRLGPRAEVRLLEDLATGDLMAEPVVAGDWVRIAELVACHADLPMGTVDASVVATAERLGVHTLATLDRRHFGVVRPSHVPALDLLP